MPVRKGIDAFEYLTVTASIHSGYLWQDVDSLIAPPKGQIEYGAAPVRHGRRLELQHQISTVGLRYRRLGVLLWTHHMEGLQEGHLTF